MRLEDIESARLDGRTVAEMKYNGSVVWPAITYHYTLSNAVRHYAGDGGKIMLANGTDYCYITATLSKVDSRGTVIEQSTVTTTPQYVSGQNYYELNGTEIHFKVFEFGLEEFSEQTSTWKGSYLAPDGTTLSTGNLTVKLQANSKNLVVESADVAVNTNYITSISCTTSSIRVYGNITRRVHYHYTSNLDGATTTDHLGEIGIYFGSSYQGYVNNGGSLNVSVGTNYNTLSRRTLSFSGSYGSYSGGCSVTQQADSLDEAIDVIVYGSYGISAVKGTGSITASGGSQIIVVTSYHSVRSTVYYTYGRGIYSQGVVRQVNDDYNVTHTTSSYFSGSKSGGNYTVSHDSMQRRVATDEITYTFTNVSDTSKTAQVTLSATNNKHTGTTRYEYSLASESSSVPFSGGYILMVATSRSERIDTYDSGPQYDETVYAPLQNTIRSNSSDVTFGDNVHTTYSINSSAPVSVPVIIPSYSQGRTIRVYMSEASDLVIEQEAAPAWDTQLSVSASQQVVLYKSGTSGSYRIFRPSQTAKFRYRRNVSSGEYPTFYYKVQAVYGGSGSGDRLVYNGTSYASGVLADIGSGSIKLNSGYSDDIVADILDKLEVYSASNTYGQLIVQILSCETQYGTYNNPIATSTYTIMASM